MVSFKSLRAACLLGAILLSGCNMVDPGLHAAGAPVLPSPTLYSHHWEFQHAFDAQGAPDLQWQIPVSTSHPVRGMQLSFSEDRRISVSRLCNRLIGVYELQQDRITIQRLAGSRMACNEGRLMQLENQVAQHLPSATQWKITGSDVPLLELQFDDGARWQFSGRPTNETLYGPAMQLFLEVAADKVTCDQPLAQGTPCLNVREIQYTSQGLKQSDGPWMTYVGVIEGYEHEAGVGKIIRIKRFTRPSASPAGSYLDVLDLVVQSTNAQ